MPPNGGLVKIGDFPPFSTNSAIRVVIFATVKNPRRAKIKPTTCVEEISIQKGAKGTPFLCHKMEDLSKNGDFPPFSTNSAIRVVIFATVRSPRCAKIKPTTCVEEISIQKTAMTPYFLSRYGINLAKKAIFTPFFTKIQS